VRPHDLELRPDTDGVGVRGEVTRIIRVGFEVRLDVTTPSQTVGVSVTRAQFLTLGLEVGSSVRLVVAPNATTVTAAVDLVDEPELVDA
jgi:sulfate transport system ATP-binding protein